MLFIRNIIMIQRYLWRKHIRQQRLPESNNNSEIISKIFSSSSLYGFLFVVLFTLLNVVGYLIRLMMIERKFIELICFIIRIIMDDIYMHNCNIP